jgi:hypothetical protein
MLVVMCWLALFREPFGLVVESGNLSRDSRRVSAEFEVDT